MRRAKGRAAPGMLGSSMSCAASRKKCNGGDGVPPGQNPVPVSMSASRPIGSRCSSRTSPMSRPESIRCRPIATSSVLDLAQPLAAVLQGTFPTSPSAASATARMRCCQHGKHSRAPPGLLSAELPFPVGRLADRGTPPTVTTRRSRCCSRAPPMRCGGRLCCRWRKVFAGRDQRKLRLVDMGCGTGRFLDFVKQASAAIAGARARSLGRLHRACAAASEALGASPI